MAAAAARVGVAARGTAGRAAARGTGTAGRSFFRFGFGFRFRLFHAGHNDLGDRLNEHSLFDCFGRNDFAVDQRFLIRDFSFAVHAFLRDLCLTLIELIVLELDGVVFDLFLSRYGQKAEECVFVDDGPRNTEAARNLGFKTVTLKNMDDLERELSKFPELAEIIKI
jgi:hypothetical protein